jgi:hypothetical protein
VTDQTPSGNRWEPTDATPAESGGAPASPPTEETRRTGRLAVLRRRLRAPGGRGWKVAAASVLLAGSGAGGYAVGHATADQREEASSSTGNTRGFGGHDPDADHRFARVPDRPPGQFEGRSEGQASGQAPGQSGGFGEGAE